MSMQNKLMPKILTRIFLGIAMFCTVAFGHDFAFSANRSASDGAGITAEAMAGEGGVKEGDILQKSLAISSDFSYQREGRSDPFMPFITEERVQAELAGEEKTLTGMQLFEPGQLTLVAIINTSSGPMAMAQDSVGKGYSLREGMKIGRTGEIINIVSNKVLIKEEAYKNARTKEIIYKTTEMVLKKEGVNE